MYSTRDVVGFRPCFFVLRCFSPIFYFLFFIFFIIQFLRAKKYSMLHVTLDV